MKGIKSKKGRNSKKGRKSEKGRMILMLTLQLDSVSSHGNV